MARLSVAGMQKILRKAAVATVSTKPIVRRERRQGGVGADVTARVQPESLRLFARTGGRLDVRIPIKVTVTPVMPGLTDVVVDYDGCKATTFLVTLPVVPGFSKDGELRFAAGKVTANNAKYRCRIYTNWLGDIGGHKSANVTRAIRQEIEKQGRNALSGLIKQINARLPTKKALQALLRQPAAFGSAISLGIDQPRVRLRGVEVDGDDYTLIGALEGFPRLRFGAEWADAPDVPAAGGVRDGFRVPARLMFPTDRRLLPDATLSKASGCLGAFRLQSVAARDDLAVLQRCDSTVPRNVIWLSGDSAPPPDSARPFERPMSNFLSDAVTWLEDPRLWRDVRGVGRLRGEVAAFRQLVERFQADTTLPIKDRGSLSFRDLGVDLHRLWVTNEAILADVSLVGNATLQLDLIP
jgi:hypothetical protein